MTREISVTLRKRKSTLANTGQLPGLFQTSGRSLKIGRTTGIGSETALRWKHGIKKSGEMGLTAATSYEPKSAPPLKMEEAGDREIRLYQQFVRLVQNEDKVNSPLSQPGN
jgi:hypothetical protein